MNNLIIANNESLTMSNVQIAELCNKRPDNVKRTMDSLSGKGLINITQFEERLKRTTRCDYYVNERDSYIVVAQLSPEFTAFLVDEWQKKKAPQHNIPQTYSAALLLAGQQAEQLELQSEQLALAAPKVEFVDRFVESTGNKTFREVAKILKANEREFRAFLFDSKVMYQLGGGWTAHANHIDAGRFYASTGEANGHAYTTCKFTPKGIEYIAGKWIAHKELS
jgi:phage antirepressor YoqD-like protein